MLLGRPPAAPWRVALRCPHGTPAVIENAVRDDRGRPFPTRFWLTCASLRSAVSRLEAAGGVRALADDAGMRGAVRAADAAHAAGHGGHRVAGAGTPGQPKCLHAHLAFALAGGGSPLADWIGARADLSWPGRCCLGRAGDPRRDRPGPVRAPDGEEGS